jgi:hypothetical protein
MNPKVSECGVRKSNQFCKITTCALQISTSLFCAVVRQLRAVLQFDHLQLAEVGLFDSFVFAEFGGGAGEEYFAGFEDVGTIAVR